MVNKIGRVRAEWIARARTAIEDAAEMATVGSRVAVRKGLAFRASPGGLAVLAKQRIKGSLGPAGLFRVHAATQPDALALVDDRMRITYGEIDQRIDRLVTRLVRRHGIGRGSAAIVVMHNRPEFVEVQAAMGRIGGAAVSASWRSTRAELEYLVAHSGAKAMFIEAELAELVTGAPERFPTLSMKNVFSIGGEHAGIAAYDDVVSHGPAEQLDGDSEDAAVVIYTSGTTGKPKGAVRRFGKEGHLAYVQLLDELPVHAGDRHLAVCPLYHSTAFAFASITYLLGGTVFVERKFDPEATLRLIAKERITTTAMVPTMLSRLLALPPEVKAAHDLRSLHAVFSGGAPLSGVLAREFIAEHGHVLWNFYGATETGMNTLATPDELLVSPGTIGHAVRGNQIRLLDDDGREVKRGATGELFVKNALLVSYHGDDDATRASMRDGFFSVGDLARQDEHGLFHIEGRKRDMIISGGVNVYPAEVEEILAQHPAVAEAAVVGIEDRDLGERVRAYVSLRQGAGADPLEIQRFCRERLSGPKVPKDVRVLAELPKNPTGKILKRELRDLG
jgi:fatty-acyl-CoA synthase